MEDSQIDCPPITILNFMKKYLLVLSFFFSVSMGYAQGIRFEDQLNWQQIREKARTEHKYIFVDCYATWCGPCKWMDKSIYPQESVGTYFNSNFINVKIQQDRTTSDADVVRSRYDDAALIIKTYDITAFPTFLFFDENGNIVHRVVGAKSTPDEFISAAKEAFDKNKQYYNQMAHVQENATDTVYLLKSLHAAYDLDDNSNAQRILVHYLKTAQNPFNKDNIKLIANLTSRTQDIGFDFFLKNAARINKALGVNNGAQGKAAQVIFTEKISPLFKKSSAINYQILVNDMRSKYPELGNSGMSYIINDFMKSTQRYIATMIKNFGAVRVDWNNLKRNLDLHFPKYDYHLPLLLAKCDYYEVVHDWGSYGDVAKELTTTYPYQINDYDYNGMAWIVFLHCDNKRALKAVKEKMEQIIKSRPSDSNMCDTYANLLYKLGNRDKALEYETTATNLLKNEPVDRPEHKALGKTFADNTTR